MSRPSTLRLAAVALAATLLPASAFAQVFVYPRRPDKSHVRYFDFDWEHVDILVGSQADTSAARRLRAPRRVPPRPGSEHPAPPGNVEKKAPGAPESPAAGLPSGANGVKAKAGEAPASEAKTEPKAKPKPPKEGGTKPTAVKPEAPKPVTAGTAAVKPTAISTTPAPSGAVKVDASKEAAAKAAAAKAAAAKAAAANAALPAGSPWRGKLGPKTGGVRLYYYKRERKVAARAAGFITEAYRYLVGKFDYVPTKTFPYILYNSYQEFLETNLFPLQEGVLGVTSPRSLKLTLPYFGDHRLFEEVSTHEMSHQFTIQKVRDIAKKAKLWGNPMESFPLWFTEGLAEYYGQHGLDPQTEMLVRDIVVNPDVRHGYAMLGFFDDRPGSVLWTYKVGQARCAFLEDTYGKGTIQRILDASPMLLGRYGKGRKVSGGFAGLLKQVTGDDKRTITEKFDSWIKKRAYRSVLASSQSPADIDPLSHFEGRVNALNASPDGNVLLYRTLDLVTYRSRLVLVDPRAPRDTVQVASDGVPGAETLHPVSNRNFALSNHALVYVAESGQSDVIYWQSYTHGAHKRAESTRRRGPGEGEDEHDRSQWNVRLSLGRRASFDLAKHGLISADSPAFSPDGNRIAFIGLTRDGQKDIFLLQPLGDGFRLTRLTDDAWAERQLWWGKSGIVYNSDATEHERYNLFRIDPDHPGTPVRLTVEDRDEADPIVLPDGRVLFTAFDHARSDIYEIDGDQIVRRTDVSTGLFNLSPGPDGGLWALWYYQGQKRPALVKKQHLITASTETMGKPGNLFHLPKLSLAGTTRYDPFNIKNWELGNLFGFFGAGAGGVFGQLIASGTDQLRNQGVILNLFIYGSLDLTDGYLFYVNQTNRLTWGGGPFQSLYFRVDQTFDHLPITFTSAERFFGVQGSLRYPFNTFEYLQVDASLGGVQYFLTPDTRILLASGVINGTGQNLLQPWLQKNAGTRFQVGANLRLGYDTIRYSPSTGPIAGSSAMLELTSDTQPFSGQTYGNVRLDAEHYIPILGTANFFIRGGAGTGFGGRLARQYYLSSFDTLRGVPFGDTNWLLGKHFFFTTAELQFPLDAIIRFILFSNIEGVVGVDFGAVGDDITTLWQKRVLDFVLGVNFGFGPLVFRLHFAKPVDTGASPVVNGVKLGLPNNGDWVTNFSLGYLYF